MPRSKWKPHETLEPTLKAGPKSPHAGQVMREVCISTEHPDPTAIAVIFDVTGSMGGVPKVLQSKLGSLHGLLVRKGYCTDPQIMFGAVGDAYCDQVPLQVGQFESDNRMDENLEALVLEGGGGGGNHESYDLALYFLAHKTYLEPYEKLDKKGYAFIIGDERGYPTVSRAHVQRLIDPDAKLQDDIPLEEIIETVQEKYNLFYVFAKQGMYQPAAVLGDIDSTQPTGARLWRPLLAEHALQLDEADAVCETIALAIGMAEGAVGLDDGLKDLKDAGASEKATEATGKALAPLGAGAGDGRLGGSMVTTTGTLPGLD